jgi:hypothetical protein
MAANCSRRSAEAARLSGAGDSVISGLHMIHEGDTRDDAFHGELDFGVSVRAPRSFGVAR